LERAPVAGSMETGGTRN